MLKRLSILVFVLSTIAKILLCIFMAATKKYQLSKEEKLRMAHRINYFRTMPAQVLKLAANLENGLREEVQHIFTPQDKAVLVNGRVLLLNIK